MIIPSHIWTPWYGLLGSRSGYNSLEECFREKTPLIRAVETGLSSDPEMCMRIPELRNVATVSFSDAHSGQNLGREVTYFDERLSFPALRSQIIKKQVKKTIEYFPEEGKYYASGHRKCGVVKVNGNPGICPICGTNLTEGVSSRIAELAGSQGKTVESTPAECPPSIKLIGLKKIISECIRLGPSSKSVDLEYQGIVDHAGSELSALTELPIEELAQFCPAKVVEGIDLVRRGEIRISPGYDGKYGEVSIWDKCLTNS